MWDRKWDELILVALNEDIGSGDVTTLSTVPPDADASGVFLAKEAGVICGLSICSRTFALLDPRIRIKSRVQEGAWVEANEVLAVIEGPSQGILMGERVSLNFLRHLSGIATQTRLAVQAVEGTKAHISDTRKTTPGLRSIEKYAVRTGGGTNHRFNLSDGILIKDNHIRAAGGIK
ncbi:MAG: carboxylating nicotinate-nucleotide diphosphorylase, partial [Clostridia bacterium]|nr:carboxylating nicotinate-nucleotide diphosphorylase [Clostridia bacterium]